MKWIIIVFTSLIISGCMNTIPQNPEEQAAYYLSKGLTAYEKGHLEDTNYFIGIALQRPTGAERVRNAFANDRRLQDVYAQGILKNILTADDIKKFLVAADSVDALRTAAALDDQELSELLQILNESLANKNRLGTLDVRLGDDYKRFSVLQEDEHRTLIFERTLSKLKIEKNSPQRPKMIEGLIAYLKSPASNLNNRNLVMEALPNLNIRLNELDSIGVLFPKFAAERRRALTLRVFVEVKNADRLFSDDVLNALKNGIRGLDLLTTPGDEEIRITIERIRHEEKSIPERTETITYANSDVDFMKAYMLMPKNASYLFDQITGGAEIDYGYVLTISQNKKKIHEDVIRGKTGGEYRRCQNARIQNVFGGITPASFSANSNMESRCGGASSISMDDLRTKAFGEIVKGILKVDTINNIHLANGV